MVMKLQSLSSETCRIEELPDDVLHHILSFHTTLAEKAFTSILSRRWKNLWLYTTCLDFDAPEAPDVYQWQRSCARFIAWVNKVIRDRIALPGLPSVKVLRIRYTLNANHSFHIDKWISFASANRVERLHLEFPYYFECTFAPGLQYVLSEKFWLRTPSGLSNIKCLKSLLLSCVNVSKQFIEFVLSSCPLLEDLSLDSAWAYTDLDVSGVPPLQLKRLKIILTPDLALTKLCAPYLISLYYVSRSRKFNPRKIDVPMLIDLTIGSRHVSQPTLKYLEPFWSCLPQLEKLELIIKWSEDFTLEQVPKLVKLNYLKICFTRYEEDMDLISYRVIRFINACPMLETLAMEMTHVKLFPDPLLIERQKEKLRELEGSFSVKCLKELLLYGAEGKTIDQEVTRFLIRNARNLKKLNVEARRFYTSQPLQTRSLKALRKKIEKLCQESHLDIEVNFI